MTISATMLEEGMRISLLQHKHVIYKANRLEAQMLYVTCKLHENICQRVLPAGEGTFLDVS